MAVAARASVLGVAVVDAWRPRRTVRSVVGKASSRGASRALGAAIGAVGALRSMGVSRVRGRGRWMTKTKSKGREQYDARDSEMHSWVHARASELCAEDGGMVDDAHWMARYRRAKGEWDVKCKAGAAAKVEG